MGYDLFEGRYTVEIGKRGRVTVISNVAHGKVLKVNGKLKDSLRFVNMTSCKGGETQSYCLEDVKNHCEGGLPLLPLTECEVREILGKVEPPTILNSVEEIEGLPQTTDRFNNICYVEDLEHYTRYYAKVDFTQRSNGLLKFHYKVSTVCKEDNITTNDTTKVFSYLDKVRFDDVSSINDEELGQVFNLINDELIKRGIGQ